MPVAPSRPRRGDSSQSVYALLHDKILSLQLKPGEKIDEERLADLCGVSRTPVREALFRLAAEGLVVLLPNRVTQVAQLDIGTLHDYLESIDLIQRAVNRWAALRRDAGNLEVIKKRAADFERLAAKQDLKGMVMANRALHIAIADAAKNALLAESYLRLLDVGIRVARFTLNRSSADSGKQSDEFVTDIVDDHNRMIDAIEQHDADEAERLALLHTERTRKRFQDYLEASGKDIAIRDSVLVGL